MYSTCEGFGVRRYFAAASRHKFVTAHGYRIRCSGYQWKSDAGYSSLVVSQTWPFACSHADPSQTEYNAGTYWKYLDHVLIVLGRVQYSFMLCDRQSFDIAFLSARLLALLTDRIWRTICPKRHMLRWPLLEKPEFPCNFEVMTFVCHPNILVEAPHV